MNISGIGKMGVGKTGVGETGQIIGETGVGEMGVGETGTSLTMMVLSHFLSLSIKAMKKCWAARCLSSNMINERANH